MRGRRATSGENCASSLSIVATSASASPAAEASTRWQSSRQRSTCLRKRSPSPAPRCAPSIRPGMSATTSVAGVVRGHDAQVRHERRERIVGDLRLRRRDRRDERRLAGVRETDDRDVGEQLQLDGEAALLAGQARLGEARGLPGGGREVLVAPAAVASLDQQDALPGRDQVRHTLAAVRVRHDGAERQPDLDVRARSCRDGWSPCRARRAPRGTGSGGAGGRACCRPGRRQPRPSRRGRRRRRWARPWPRTSHGGRRRSRCRRRRP